MLCVIIAEVLILSVDEPLRGGALELFDWSEEVLVGELDLDE